MKTSKKMEKKAVVLSLVMASLMLLPQTMTAQYNEDKYGIQPWFGSSLLGREGSRSSNGGDALNLQNFGEDVKDLTLQTFGEEAPLGSGLLVLFAAGLGYVARKKQTTRTSI